MKQLPKMSIEELNKEQKSTKFITAVLIGAFIGSIFLAFQNGFNMLTMIPVFFLPLVIINFNRLKKIKEELRLRG
jgi:hypothetical protein